MQWLRDNLKMIRTSDEVESLAKTVDDNGGCYIVPAFSGLFAPYWKSNARGVFAGLTRYINAGHIARATLEATAFQSREVADAMNEDSGVPLESLRVDGGMVVNETLMQFQADILGVPVIRPQVAETTALGAAYAAGLATGFWESEEDLRQNWAEDKRWDPQMDESQRARAVRLLEEGGHPHLRLARLTQPALPAGPSHGARGRPVRYSARWSASSSSPTAPTSPTASSSWRARWAARR